MTREGRSTVEVLKAARKRIEDPERWAKGEFAYGEGGECLDANSPEACKWCAAGAVLAELGVDEVSDDAVEPLTALVRTTPGLIDEDLIEAVAHFNDNSDHASVLAAFSRAIQLAESQEGES